MNADVPRTPVVVAIDGPAGSGKSTVAAGLAERLGVAHVDTGAYYRAATYLAQRNGADVDDEAQVLTALRGSTIVRRGGRTHVDGRDIEEFIRGPRVTADVSTVAKLPGVRRHLVELQRAAVTAAGAVVEGRDAGTVVVPDADLKVWLTADVATRAARRALQAGSTEPEYIAAEARRIADRDGRDAGQMVRAQDVVEVDTSGRTVGEVVEQVALLASVHPKAQP